LSWPGWLTCRGWLTHISGHPSAASRTQDSESSLAKDQHSTTVPSTVYCRYIQQGPVSHSTHYRSWVPAKGQWCFAAGNWGV